VVRFKLPRKEEVKFYDEIRGWVSFNSNQMDDKVLYKSDGMPTYHMANVVDDYLMKITHVIRGEEWLPSAPLHVLLYRALGWETVMPKFAHLPLLLKPEGNGKLSKRDGDRLGFPVFPLNWVDPSTGEMSSGYREAGYLPEAVINLLAMLGWNPGSNQEIFTMDELIAAFSLERVSKSGAKFDQNKAKWYNHQYLKKLEDQALLPFLRESLVANGLETNFSDDYCLKVCGLIKEKMSFTKEIWDISKYFFLDPANYDLAVIQKRWNEKIPKLLKDIQNGIASAETLDATAIEKIYNDCLNLNDISGKDFLQLFRVCLTGVAGGPPLFEIAALVGRDALGRRIDHAIQEFENLHKQ
jgi:glutamyl-tRNA synthetase